ncbi:MAG: FlgD immunoglobulin-like domain containing protein [bacterium]
MSVNTDESANFWTIKYDKDSGAQIWDRSLPGALNNAARAGWLAVADNDDIFMCNRTWTGTTSYDVVLYRFAAADGATVWNTTYNGPTSNLDDPRSMIRDAAGDLYVVGVQSSDFMTAKFDGDDGDWVWTSNYNGPPGWYDVANCAIFTPGGELVVSGFSDGSGTGWDVATVGYDPADGAEQWAVRYNGVDNQSDESRALAVTDLGDIYVTGYTYSYTTNMDILALRYHQDELSGVRPPLTAARLLSAYPNPFNPRVAFAVELPAAAPVHLAIHDLRGRLISTIHDGRLGAGNHTLSWDGTDANGSSVASGVYLARMVSGLEVDNTRIVLTK